MTDSAQRLELAGAIKAALDDIRPMTDDWTNNWSGERTRHEVVMLVQQRLTKFIVKIEVALRSSALPASSPCPYAEDGSECLLEAHSFGPCLCANPVGNIIETSALPETGESLWAAIRQRDANINAFFAALKAEEDGLRDVEGLRMGDVAMSFQRLRDHLRNPTRPSPDGTVREALKRNLNISSDHDHRSWADIERALQPPQADGRGASEEHPVLKHADELHELGFNAGWDGAVEECAKIALAIDSGRGNEKEIAKAIRAALARPQEGAEVTDKTPRCEICDWPLADSQAEGCVPGDCSYRPDDPAEQRRISERRASLSRPDLSATEIVGGNK